MIDLVAEQAPLGGLERWLRDPTVNEVMVNGGTDVWVERGGQLQCVGHIRPGTLLGVIGALLALPIAAGLRMMEHELRFEMPGDDRSDEDGRARDLAAEALYTSRSAGAEPVAAAAIASEIAHVGQEADVARAEAEAASTEAEAEAGTETEAATGTESGAGAMPRGPR